MQAEKPDGMDLSTATTMTIIGIIPHCCALKVEAKVSLKPHTFLFVNCTGFVERRRGEKELVRLHANSSTVGVVLAHLPINA